MLTVNTQQEENLAAVPSSTARKRLRLLLGLPEPLRDFMLREETTKTLTALLEEKYGFPVKQGNQVAKVMWLVVIGEIPIKQFIPALIEDANLDEQEARNIAKDINKQIFQPVRDELMQVHNISPDNGMSLNGGSTPPARPQGGGTPSAGTGGEGAPRPSKEGGAENAADAQSESASQQPKKEAAVKTEEQETLVPKDEYEGAAENGMFGVGEHIHKKIRADANNAELRQGDEGKEGEKGSEEHDARRKELLERLRQSQQQGHTGAKESIPAPEEQVQGESPEGGGEQTPVEENEPVAVTAAWDGKSIDLSKIPPRREVSATKEESFAAKQKEEEPVDEKSEYHVRLKKGSDGYYYEV